MVQVAVEAHQGSGWILNLGCAVEQAQQAEREFSEIPAERFTRMEPLGAKLALQPDAQVSPLKRDGEMLVIGKHLNAAEDISKQAQCVQALEMWTPLAEIHHHSECFGEQNV